MKNKSFALSTLALLIQAAIAMQAHAAEPREIPVDKTTQYIGLITQDEDQLWTDDSITVTEMIYPIWVKNSPQRKLGVATTGEGENGNLKVEGSYGILSYAEKGLEYKPELYIRSNNDIIFNNNTQSVYIYPHSNDVSLEAKGKIDFNLNLLEKTLDNKLVNDKSLIKYLNYTTDNSKGLLSLTSKLGNHLNLNAKIHNGIHHSGIVNHLNTNVNLTATEGDNVISLNGQLMDKIADPTNFSTSSYLRGIETAFKSHTNLTGENNKVSIKTEGDGLGLGKENPSEDSPYSGHTTGIFINNQPNNLNQPTIDGFSSVNLKATKGNNEVDINVRNHSSVKGIIATHNAKATLEAEKGNNIIKVKNPDLKTPIERAEGKHFRTGVQSSTDSQITLTAKNNIVEVAGNPMYQEGLQVDSNSSITATAKENNEITVENAAYGSDGVSTLIPQANGRPSLTNDGNKIILEAGKDNIITMKATDADMDYLRNSTVLKETDYYEYKKGSNGILSAGETSLVKLTGENNYILTELSDKARAFEHNGVMSEDGAKVEITAKENNAIAGANNGSKAETQATVTIDGRNNTILAFKNAMKSSSQGQQNVTAREQNEVIGGASGIWTVNEGSSVTLKGKNNKISAKLALYADNKSKQTLDAEENNEINGNSVAVYSNDESSIRLNSQKNNIINTNVNAKEPKTTGLFAAKNGSISLTAEEDNEINAKHEGIKANSNATIELTATNKNTINSTTGNSQGIITSTGGRVSLTANENLISTKLYGINADSKSTVTLRAKTAETKNETKNEIKNAQFGIYANDNSSVSLTASNNIINSTNVGISSLNNATVDVNGQIKLSSKIANHASKEGSIKLNYANKSEITGATLSNGGNIAIKPLDFSPHTMALTGDVLSVNKGKVELNLTPNSHLVGRLDNFAQFDHPEHKNINNLDAQSAGEINLNLAKDAVWTMTGQSWLDKLEGQGTIDFNNDAKASGRSLHIGELAGANKFLMHLNKDGAHSDMIYVKKGTTTPQDVTITNLSEVLDMMNYGDRLRFATIQENSGNEFIDGKRYIDDSHLMEQALTVEYSDHQSDPSNKPDYNLAFNGDKMTAEKAGNADVDAMYNGEHRKNVYLVKKKLNPDCNCNNPSKGVKDVTGMFDSTAHYAFTLDTYTKREGERAYSSLDKKDGAWVRAVHTKLTQSGVFRFHNNDYEIGYDKFSRNDTEKKRKWGLSFTYGRAKVSLSNQFSKGRIKKYELSFYNTNQRQNKEGDDSAYHDNVLRIGLLRSHSYASMNNGKLWGKGSYRNKYFTVSTEYGYRKFINDDKRWYVVPQAQLQFTYLNGVDYKLSNGVNVSLNHTKSLIGRVGIDIVRLLDDEREQKDLRERRFYIKGNILHEFLAKRSFIGSYSADNYSKTWNNRGTWYAIGLGYNAHVSEKTYIFIDAERELGAGRANSYNARLAISWQFK